jgi:hypothetical protein
LTTVNLNIVPAITPGGTVSGNISTPTSVAVLYPQSNTTSEFLSVPMSVIAGTFTLYANITLGTIGNKLPAYDYTSGGNGDDATFACAIATSRYEIRQGSTVIASGSSPAVPAGYATANNSDYLSLSETKYVTLNGLTNLSNLSIHYFTQNTVATRTVTTWQNYDIWSSYDETVTSEVDVSITNVYLSGVSGTTPYITSFTSDKASATRGSVVHLTSVFGNGTATLSGNTAPYTGTIGTLTSGVPYAVTMPDAPGINMSYKLVVSNGNATYDQTSYVTVAVTDYATLTGTLTSNLSTSLQSTDIILTATFGAGLTGTIDQGVGAVTSGVGKTVTLPGTVGNITYSLTVNNGSSSAVVDTVTVGVTAPAGTGIWIPSTLHTIAGITHGSTVKVWDPELWDGNSAYGGVYPRPGLAAKTVTYDQVEALTGPTRKQFYYFDPAGTTFASGTAPAIQTQPANVSVAQLTSATHTVTCTTSSFTPITYVWHRQTGGSQVPGSDPVVQTTTDSMSTSSSYLPSTATAGTYQYYCVITNTLGTVTSTTATLTVSAGSAPWIGTAQPIAYSYTTMMIGESPTFYVAASGSGTVTIRWYKNATLVKTETAGVLESAYTFTAVSGDNNADIYATATNLYGTTTSNHITFYCGVGVSTVTGLPGSSTATEGVSKTFGPVTVSGDTPYTYQWFWYLPAYNDQYAIWTLISGATSSSYTFTPALTDSGKKYRCLVTNAYSRSNGVLGYLGASDTNTTLTVNPASTTYRPTTGNGSSALPNGVDAGGISTFTQSTTMNGNSSTTYNFTGFGSGTKSGIFSIAVNTYTATTYEPINDITVESAVNFSYSLDGTNFIYITSALGGAGSDYTYTVPIETARISNVNLATIAVRIQVSGGYASYTDDLTNHTYIVRAAAHIELYDVTFVSS